MSKLQSYLKVASSLVIAALAGGCESDPVFLNERAFELEGESMKLVAAGCASYSFGGLGHSSTSGAGGNVDGDYVIAQRSGAEFVTVEVRSQGHVLIERHYDESFLRSGRLDELRVATKGGKNLLLRYWGPECTPTTELSKN